MCGKQLGRQGKKVKNHQGNVQLKTFVVYVGLGKKIPAGGGGRGVKTERGERNLKNVGKGPIHSKASIYQKENNKTGEKI